MYTSSHGASVNTDSWQAFFGNCLDLQSYSSLGCWWSSDKIKISVGKTESKETTWKYKTRYWKEEVEWSSCCQWGCKSILSSITYRVKNNDVKGLFISHLFWNRRSCVLWMVAVIKEDLLVYLQVITRTDLIAKQSFFRDIRKWTAKGLVKKKNLQY